ncbi:hypothetical protein QQF64_002118 [Cirrhinus molitorella]|uniref:Integrase catalytic domain-containing protein n=1 Tax=Cirrhinus molitorella TaxID=172907 RepID=A0ABR3MP76_9TELE
MASFDLKGFVETPLLEQLDTCKKDDLFAIASHFQITVNKQSRKAEIKSIVLDRLVEMNVLGLPAQADTVLGAVPVGASATGENESEEESMPGAEAEADVRARLPPFEPFSPESISSKGETRLKVRLARLQLEAQEKAQTRQAELDLRLQIRKLEIEAEKQVKMRQLELDAMRIVGGSAAPPDLPRVVTAAVGTSPHLSSTPTVSPVSVPSVANESFDVTKYIALVPPFRETEIDLYFNAFERIATSFRWPSELWALLLQCRLSGKALEVFSALSLEDSLNYEIVKSTILRAYELVPEAYRQKFRGHKKNPSHTFVEFAREKSLLFDKWCTATKSEDFDSLRELILLEEFKGCLPERVVVYLNEQKVSSLSQAAFLADEFVLTHKGTFSVTRSEKSVITSSSQNQTFRTKINTSQSKEVRDCFYCHKLGHTIADCPVLKRKQQGQNSKSVALLKTVPLSELLTCAELDKSYKPFVMTGFVSLSGKEEDRKEISILRDTGAMQSIILSNILPFSDESYCGSNILIRGIEMQVVPVPLHRVHLDCTLVTGFVRVGIRSSLPVNGITFILGNDLAGGNVVPALEVSDIPSACFPPNDVAYSHPDVFSACAVTRAQSGKAVEQVDLNDPLVEHVLTDDEQNCVSEMKKNDVRDSVKVSKNLLGSFNSLDLPISRAQIIAAQKDDPSLSKPNQVIARAPLSPIPVVGEAFEEVLVDCVGPLPKTKAGNQYLCTIMCRATRFPEAIPLRNIKAPVILKSLIKFFSVFGLPKVIQTDQGTNFLSRVFSQTLKSLSIKHRVSSAHHPESQGVLERFHQTLKSMLRKYCLETSKDWDEGIPLVLFAVRESVQESLGFSPAEMVFGHTVRGPLKVLKDKMLESDTETRTTVIDYVSRFRQKLHSACNLARDFLKVVQSGMKTRHDRKAIARSFQLGDKVLVFLPNPGSALTARFTGPYKIIRKLSDTDYIIDTPERRRKTRVCHINMLKAYYDREIDDATQEVTNNLVLTSEVVGCDMKADEDGLLLRNTPQQCGRLDNSAILANLPSHLCNLPAEKMHDVVKLVTSFPSLFSDVPSQTNVMRHDIDVQNAKPIKQHAYRVNAVKRAVMKKETDYLVENGLARYSCSSWSSRVC